MRRPMSVNLQQLNMTDHHLTTIGQHNSWKVKAQKNQQTEAQQQQTKLNKKKFEPTDHHAKLYQIVPHD